MATATITPSSSKALVPVEKKHRHFHARHLILAIVAVLAVGLIAARLYLDVWALNYVNRVLNNIEGYKGSVQALDIDLYRGAYTLYDLKVVKKKGSIPTPFINIAQTDFSIQWNALFHGRIVSEVDLAQPVLNFAVNKSGNTMQTGKEADWVKAVKDLMPIDINHVTFRNGKLTYKDFSTSPNVNVYIHKMRGEITNLRNIEDANVALPSNLTVRGTSIGGGKLQMEGKLNILRKIPNVDIDTKLERVHLPALNNYTRAYAGIDVEEGNLDVYSEFIIKNGRVSGYIKPLATHIALIDLRKDSDPIKLIWESIASVVLEVFSNQAKDQFATKVTLEGNLENVKTDTWSIIAGILRNAFVEAFRRGIDADLNWKSAPN